MGYIVQCDIAIVGGGLAGCLAALALHAAHPELDVRIIERGDRLGGNHLWSYFLSDLPEGGAALVEPITGHRWPGYEVRFPDRARELTSTYCSIRSERLDAHVRATLPAKAVMSGTKALAVEPKAVVLADGDRIEARTTIDARGTGDLGLLDLGWQKFVGLELQVKGGHGLTRPVIMDATVPQVDGYRFVYSLPFSDDTLLIEDTYYSDDAALDEAGLAARITNYASRHGWQDFIQLRRETGVLPVALGGDFDAYWLSGGSKVAKLGLRAGLFHPTTGYSLPDAVRTALLLAAQRDFSNVAIHALLHDHARAAWRDRHFYRLLDRMLFRAAEPDERYRIMARFYRLDQALIERFYAARSTFIDKARILIGKPPVSISRAMAQIIEQKKGRG